MSSGFPVFAPEIHHWSDEALCRFSDPEMWFPKKGNLTPGNQMAIQICQRCPVIDDCLEDGLSNEFGIFGGLTAPQRARLRKERGLGEQLEESA